MTIILFVIILALLILVHEFGHFIVAKKSGIRVDEFGLGFPPKVFGKKVGETEYTLNWIPFGGFVKIFGENPDEESIKGEDSSRSFVNKNRGIQAAVLVAGVTFNMIFAWLLISFGFMVGMPVSSELYPQVKNTELTIVRVYPDTPASKAGLQGGDTITSILPVGDGEVSMANLNAEEAHQFFQEKSGKEIKISYKRGVKEGEVSVTAEDSVLDEEDVKLIGITMDNIGILRLNPFASLWEGGKSTVKLTATIAVALWDFVKDAVTGNADFNQVSGPVGIVGLVGEASQLGFVYLVSFTALISIHLAIINLVPFPALDGGRLLFVAIEAITRKPINPKIANTINAVGFFLLIFLMLFVTYKDIVKLFT